MNWAAIRAIYIFEMSRFFRTFLQSLISPVISTSLYFVVFGAAIGSRIDEVNGVSYAAFIVPGLIMLTVMTQAISNASFGIYFPKFIGTIYELLSAPISFFEIVLGYVGAAATKALFIGIIILITSFFFVRIDIQHPIAMFAFPDPDLHKFCAVWLYHRHLGKEFRTTSIGSTADCNAVGVPWRVILFDHNAATLLADRIDV